MTFIDTTDWPTCPICHRVHGPIFMHGAATPADFADAERRAFHPWLLPDRERNMRDFDLFPRWTAARAWVQTRRWRIVKAWLVLCGSEDWDL